MAIPPAISEMVFLNRKRGNIRGQIIRIPNSVKAKESQKRTGTKI